MGRAFVNLEAHAAAKRTKSGVTLGHLFVYPYGTYVGKDVIVYAHTEGRQMPISSLEGFFISRTAINLSDSPGANLPCRRGQMHDFERKYDGYFAPFDEE